MRLCIARSWCALDIQRDPRERMRREDKAESRAISDEFSLLERATSDSQSFDHSNGDQTKKKIGRGGKQRMIQSFHTFHSFFLSFFLSKHSKSAKMPCLPGYIYISTLSYFTHRYQICPFKPVLPSPIASECIRKRVLVTPPQMCARSFVRCEI